MIRRILLGTAVFTGLVAVVLWLTFPTDAVVRRLLGAVRLPQQTTLEFAQARLRPSGLRLEQAALRRPDGSAALEAEWIRLRPSLLGLLGRSPGAPWTVSAAACGGEMEVTWDDDGATQMLDARWDDLDVGACLYRWGAPDAVAGRASGSTSLRMSSGAARPTGSGSLTMRDAAWKPPVAALEGAVVRADSAVARWTLGTDRLGIDQVDVRGPDLDLLASGEALLAQKPGDARLHVSVRLTPMPGMPRQLRRVLEGFPRDADGDYVFRIGGTTNAPRIEPP